MTDKFTLEFGLDVFDELNHLSSQSFYSTQSDRFELPNGNYDLLPASDEGWMMYWVGENTLNAIVAERILLAAGYKVHRLWDMNDNPEPEWCLLTDFKDKMWRRQDSRLYRLPGYKSQRTLLNVGFFYAYGTNCGTEGVQEYIN